MRMTSAARDGEEHDSAEAGHRFSSMNRMASACNQLNVFRDAVMKSSQGCHTERITA